jgi:4-diphosphocytidyl-2-C-methyl-D-erythritol kinase
VVVFPNCKINLGLSVLRKRADNFHDLQTVFYPLPFYEPLELIRSASNSFSQTGIALHIQPDDNICMKAWKLVKADYPALPEVSVHLHKCIPAGAGLGGGSADGAFMLKALDKYFRLQIPPEKMMEYALSLGSDCPFFLLNSPCVATGRGEQLVPVDLSLSGFSIVIINPGIHVSTATAFSSIVPQVPETDIADIILLAPDSWKNELHNDFEKPVFSMYPEISAIKTKLYDSGAVYAAMSGSGSTVFGLFEKSATTVPWFPANYLVRRFEL